MKQSYMIELDTEEAKKYGFTSDKFDGYLWRDGQRILVSFIMSIREGAGNLSSLFSAIERDGLNVAVPTPFPRMQLILMRKGFAPHVERDEMGNSVMVWEKSRV